MKGCRRLGSKRKTYRFCLGPILYDLYMNGLNLTCSQLSESSVSTEKQHNKRDRRTKTVLRHIQFEHAQFAQTITEI